MPSQAELVLPMRDPLSPPLRTNHNFKGTPYAARPWFELLTHAATHPLVLHWRSAPAQHAAPASADVHSLAMVPVRGCAGFVAATILSDTPVHVLEVSERAHIDHLTATVGCVVDMPSRVLLAHGHPPRLEARVSPDPRLDDCIRAVRPKDKYVEILYEASPLWLRCSLVYAKVRSGQEAAWNKSVKLPMQRYSLGRNGRNMFSLVLLEPLCDLDSEMIEFCFVDGRRLGAIDSNSGNNFAIGCHGKYEISHEGGCLYLGPADLDIE